MATSDEDPIVSVLPVHFNSTLADTLHLHQFPLLARPLQVPPSAAQSGKKINARVKRKAGRVELHVPFDTRTEVWNRERGKELGQARAEDDQEKSGSQSKKASQEIDQSRLNELRLRSEQVPCRCAYVLGIVRDGMLQLLSPNLSLTTPPPQIQVVYICIPLTKFTNLDPRSPTWTYICASIHDALLGMALTPTQTTDRPPIPTSPQVPQPQRRRKRVSQPRKSRKSTFP